MAQFISATGRVSPHDHNRRPEVPRRARYSILAIILAMIAFVPTIEGQPIDRVSTFRNMLGKPKNQTSIQTTIKQLGQYRVEKLEPTNAEYYYSFPERGIEIHFNADHAIEFIVLLNEKAFAQYGKYAGSLPKQLTFADNEAAAVKKLGQPENTEEFADEKERVLFYDSQGFSVVLHGGDDSRKGQIKYVELYAPKKS